MKYELKQYKEILGDITLMIETLADLDATIDALCDGVDEKSAEAVFVEDLCPYFGVVWPAARALSEHLGRMGGWLKGKTVLELGCGLALPSLVCAKMGAHVTASDFHPEVPKFLERNRTLNDVTTEQLKYEVLDWRNTEPKQTYDFVIGSDVLYESKHPHDVAKALAAHCHRGSHIILTDPGRTYLQPCLDGLAALGFHSDVFVKAVRDGHDDRAGDRATKEVFVCVLQKRL